MDLCPVTMSQWVVSRSTDSSSLSSHVCCTDPGLRLCSVLSIGVGEGGARGAAAPLLLRVGGLSPPTFGMAHCTWPCMNAVYSIVQTEPKCISEQFQIFQRNIPRLLQHYACPSPKPSQPPHFLSRSYPSAKLDNVDQAILETVPPYTITVVWHMETFEGWNSTLTA